ncbi:MAG TPA: 50S ribosomal protein L22 [Candidatus Saccharimonadales bacterium]
MADVKTVSAAIKGITQAPRKVSLVASLVRGRRVADAMVILDHTPKRAALAVKKAIASAKANAVNTHKLDEKSLIVEQLSVTTGTRLKRFRAGARGMAKPYQKKTSHIFVSVSGEAKSAKKPVKKAEEK